MNPTGGSTLAESASSVMSSSSSSLSSAMQSSVTSDFSLLNAQLSKKKFSPKWFVERMKKMIPCVKVPFFLFLLSIPLSIIIITSFTISFFWGKNINQTEKELSLSVFTDFVNEFIIMTGRSAVTLSIDPIIREFVCLNQSDSTLKEETDNFLIEFSQSFPNVHFLHHLRIINQDGMELNRIDFEHNDESSVSAVLYNMSSTSYHSDFLSGYSYSSVFISPWTTHGPLPNGSYYDFYGEDLTGDHHSDHLEFLPLPQVTKFQKTIVCPNTTEETFLNDDRMSGYIIFNVRMVKLISEIDHLTPTFGSMFVLNRDGDYIYLNTDRTKEFQSLLGKEQTLGSDWNVDASAFVDKVFSKSTPHSFLRFLGVFDFTCSVIQSNYGNGFEYGLCLELPTWHFFFDAPLPIIAGLIVDVSLCTMIFCLYYNYIVRRNGKRFKKLVYSIYPSHIAEDLLTGSIWKKGKGRMLARFEEDIVVVFSDIVSFVKYNAQLDNDPIKLVSFLSNLFDMIDTYSTFYEVIKIKTIGDCYFGAIGLKFGKGRIFMTVPGEPESDERVKERSDNCYKMVEFCSLYMEFFKRHTIRINERDYPLPQMRAGVHCGGVIAGILNEKTPFFDLFGETVNMASRLESKGVPQMVHISADVYSYLNKYRSKIRFAKQQHEIKGFGFVKTYQGSIKKSSRFELIHTKAKSLFLKKHEDVFLPLMNNREPTSISSYRNSLNVKREQHSSSIMKKHFKDEKSNNENNNNKNYYGVVPGSTQAN